MLAFLASAQVTSKTAAAFVIHKPFMVVTKYCDLVLEPSFRKAGLDFYKRGTNIATANILTTTMPVFLNPTTWSNFLSLFVRVVRERTPSLFNEWRRLAELIFAQLEHTERESADFFAPVFLMSDSSELFAGLGDDELDAGVDLALEIVALVDHVGDVGARARFPLEEQDLVENPEHLVRIDRSQRIVREVISFWGAALQKTKHWGL